MTRAGQSVDVVRNDQQAEPETPAAADSVTIPSENKIIGVELKQLRTFPDDRGFFREIIRDTDPFFNGGFGQWSHSKMARNTVKAWHYHHLQTDWWYVGLGVVQTVLYDNREESPSYKQKFVVKLGESELDAEARSLVVKIPPGVLHGCKVLSDTAHLFYITSHTYNPDDEGRFPFDSPLVPHPWGNPDELIVAANDRRTFVPVAPRAR